MTTTARQTRSPTPQPLLGIVKNTYPRIDASRPAVNDAEFSSAAELDAWARRTLAANGFGHADVPAPATAVAAAGGLPSEAPLPRSASFRQICVAIGEALVEATARFATRWREHRALRRTYRALADLDERTLKDIGFGPNEAGSIATELAGQAERTRIQALRTLQYLSI